MNLVQFSTQTLDFKGYGTRESSVCVTALGLVPGERSTGETVRRGSITKAGNGRVRHMLVESAWTYRHPPRIGARKLYRLGPVDIQHTELRWSKIVPEQEKSARRCYPTVEHFRRIQGRFWTNPEGAARKSAISASLVVEYALACPSSSLLELADFRCGAARAVNVHRP